jgi:hypothetical protein
VLLAFSYVLIVLFFSEKIPVILEMVSSGGENSRGRFGSPSRQSVEHFHEGHGGFAISLDPFGMLDPQVVVNLLPKLGVVVDLVIHGNWLIWKITSRVHSGRSW